MSAASVASPSFTVALAVTLVLCPGCSTPRPQPESAGEAVDDASITAAIKTQLIKQKLGLVRQIGVTTDHGRVVLSGEVETEQQKQRVGAIARQVHGVREVVNQLAVAPGD